MEQIVSTPARRREIEAQWAGLLALERSYAAELDRAERDLTSAQPDVRVAACAYRAKLVGDLRFLAAYRYRLLDEYEALCGLLL